MQIPTLSFDDGHERDRDVIGVLLKTETPATFYIVANRTYKEGHDESWCSECRLDALSLEHHLDAASYLIVEIGSHTMQHLRQPVTDDFELKGSKERLEEWCGRPVVAFAYPCGKASLEMAEAVKAAGYTFARTFAVDPENAYQIPEPFLLPITAYLDDPSYDHVWQKQMRAGKPIHLAGHGYHYDSPQKLARLASVIGDLKGSGYRFISNTEFVSQCLEAQT